MRLRHVLLLGSGAGAMGALLLAADIHRRVQEAQRDSVLGTVVTGADSVIHFGDAHTLGLLALAFLFIAMFLMVISEPLRKSAPETLPAAAAIPAPVPVPVSVATLVSNSVPERPAETPKPVESLAPAIAEPAAAAPAESPAALPAPETPAAVPQISETKETPAKPDAV